ncbi:small, acid-soluble spore protein, alpha/beta type [bacterium D16-51]|nr:small, acid-soluble spore protein, alpha/beta type [bacterium D16-59]RKI56195.1 small, acid-soluble spore protein, alpha/beta type [bacterium D16-51]
MKKKIEVKKPEDIEKLKKEEQEKWEIALELGLFDKVVDNGWRSLTAKESGRIGGILSSRKGKKGTAHGQ